VNTVSHVKVRMGEKPLHSAFDRATDTRRVAALKWKRKRNKIRKRKRNKIRKRNKK
jgi:hypothetical protein